MSDKKVKARPHKPPRDGRGLGGRNPECERFQEGLPRQYRNQRTRPGLGRRRKS